MCLLFCATNAFGDTWAKTYGGTGSEHVGSVQLTSDNGYILAGHTSSFGAGLIDGWVLKLDSSGVVQWQKTYGGSSHDFAESVQLTSDNGYIVTGRTESFGAGDSDAWLLKLDSSGIVQWQKTYGGTGYEGDTLIQQTSDNGHILAGRTDSFGAGFYDIWLLKLDSSGVVQWQKTYGGTGYEKVRSVQQTNDGGYIVTARTHSFGAGGSDILLLKLDSNGNISECDIVGISDVIETETMAIVESTSILGNNSSAIINDTSASLQDTSSAITIICFDDEDGIPNAEDNCPDDYNPNQEDIGDSDGVGDICDNCPDTPNPLQEDTYPPQGNGIGDVCDCECDFDCSGGVDATDVNSFLIDFGRNQFNNPCTNESPCNGDVDCSGGSDSFDVTMFLEDFGRNEFNNPCPTCVAGDWCVGGNICQSNDDCSFFYTFCSKPTGQCDGEGICNPIPISCPFMPDPVCGCDGNTYINSCDAMWWRQSIDYWGTCVE
jgi:hypothetical protein